jgi:hypothetical protein
MQRLFYELQTAPRAPETKGLSGNRMHQVTLLQGLHLAFYLIFFFFRPPQHLLNISVGAIRTHSVSTTFKSLLVCCRTSSRKR